MLWIAEKLRGAGRRIVAGMRWLWRRAAAALGGVAGSTWRKLVLGLPVAFVLYILIGMPIAHRIDDTLDMAPEPVGGGAHVVAMTARLVERETRDHNWLPNDPMILPGWWLDNTPNFQRGMMGALSRFVFELRDQLGRRRGSSAEDADLEQAAGNLSKEADRWIINFSTSLLPTTPADSYYREAARQLRAYNARLGKGDAVFDRRADNLLATLDRVALDLGSSSAALDEYIAGHGGGFLPDTGADDLFYRTKGQVYAYTMVLKALKKDFREILEDRDLVQLFDELIASLSAAARLDPLVVTNGAVAGVLANHLAMQGFYLLRARTQMREVTNVLLK